MSETKKAIERATISEDTREALAYLRAIALLRTYRK